MSEALGSVWKGAKQGSGITLNYAGSAYGHNKVTDKVPSSLAVPGHCQWWFGPREVGVGGGGSQLSDLSGL